MKKVLRLIGIFALSALMLVSTAVFAAETLVPENVEISFAVGDDTIIINGEEVKTETAPYVVETPDGGVTLVPVRVITEAFGARVDWEEETQTVTLDYPEVYIVLQIGNPIAEVNGEAVELLTAPELPGGRTMVPLRFISENFGAEVGYDDETMAITVVKTPSEDGETVLDTVIDTEYVGDSYYGWSMKNPKFEYSEYDGMQVAFMDQNFNMIMAGVETVPDDFELEDYIDDLMSSFGEEAAVTKDEIDAENQKVVLQLTADGSTVDIIMYVREEYIYACIALYADEHKDVFAEIAESFIPEFRTENCHDFNTLVDGKKEYKNEEMNFSLLLPPVLEDYSDSDILNKFTFVANDGTNTALMIEIVSKTESLVTPEEYVTYMGNVYGEFSVSGIVEVTEAEEKTYGDLKVVEVTEKITSENRNAVAKYIAFELGEYQYRIIVQADYDDVTKNEEVVNSIMESAVFGEMDAKKIGNIIDMTDFEADKEEYEVKLGNYAIKMPGYFEEAYEASGTLFLDKHMRFTGSATVMVLPDGFTIDILVESILDGANSLSGVTGYEITGITDEGILEADGFTFKVLAAAQKTDITSGVEYMYIAEKDGYAYIITLGARDEYNSEKAKALFESIVKSIKPIEE